MFYKHAFLVRHSFDYIHRIHHKCFKEVVTFCLLQSCFALKKLDLKMLIIYAYVCKLKFCIAKLLFAHLYQLLSQITD